MKIECRNLTLKFGEQVILNDLTISFPERSINTIIGPSGTGKSTLLRLIATLEDPPEGKIYYDGKAHNELHPLDIRGKVAMIFQKPTLFEGTVYDNLIFGLKLRQLKVNESKIRDILRQVDIPESYLDKLGDELSMGEQQRICIIRSLLLDPEVILLDEPVSALDPQRATRILKLILKLKTDFNKTVIMVSHNMNDALKYSDNIFFLSGGHLIYSGKAEELSDSDNPVIQKFMVGEDE